MAEYIRKHFVCESLLVALLFAQSVALAQGPEGERHTVWHCWYNHDESFTVACEYQGPPEPMDAASLEAEDDEFIEVARPNRALKLPAIVRTIREKPASLQEQQILIPLYTHPYDMDFVIQLANAVMCGTAANCSVVFDRGYFLSASRSQPE